MQVLFMQSLAALVHLLAGSITLRAFKSLFMHSNHAMYVK